MEPKIEAAIERLAETTKILNAVMDAEQPDALSAPDVKTELVASALDHANQALKVLRSLD